MCCTQSNTYDFDDSIVCLCVYACECKCVYVCVQYVNVHQFRCLPAECDSFLYKWFSIYRGTCLNCYCILRQLNVTKRSIKLTIIFFLFPPPLAPFTKQTTCSLKHSQVFHTRFRLCFSFSVFSATLRAFFFYFCFIVRRRAHKFPFFVYKFRPNFYLETTKKSFWPNFPLNAIYDPIYKLHAIGSFSFNFFLLFGFWTNCNEKRSKSIFNCICIQNVSQR